MNVINLYIIIAGFNHVPGTSIRRGTKTWLHVQVSIPCCICSFINSLGRFSCSVVLSQLPASCIFPLSSTHFLLALFGGREMLRCQCQYAIKRSVFLELYKMTQLHLLNIHSLSSLSYSSGSMTIHGPASDSTLSFPAASLHDPWCHCLFDFITMPDSFRRLVNFFLHSSARLSTTTTGNYLPAGRNTTQCT